MAPHDLRGDRRLDVGEVEDALLGGQLGVEHDLQPQVAELAGQLGRGAGLERVVDLVGLLEQVLAQRLVGLLAVPRAAVGLAQPGGDPGHRPRSGDRQLRRDRAEVERRLERRCGQRRDGRPVGRPEPSDRMIRRVEPGQERQRVASGRPGTAGQREQRQRRSPRRAGSRAGRSAAGATARSARRPASPPRTPGGRRPDRDPSGAAPPRRARRAPAPPVSWRRSVAMVSSRVIVDRGLLRVVPAREGRRRELLELPALGRPRLLGEDLEQVRPVAGDGHDDPRSCRSAWRRWRR